MNLPLIDLAGRPAVQQPTWPDPLALEAARQELSALPPLVFAGECDLLTERMAAAARGEAFVLQGGDCAEDQDVAADGCGVDLRSPNARGQGWSHGRSIW